jgi:hypothetical protein
MPITLLNCSTVKYKLLARVLVQRLHLLLTVWWINGRLPCFQSCRVAG